MSGDSSTSTSSPSSKEQHKATLRDVADYAGVSHITVSRYIRQPEKLSTSMKARVRAAVEAMQYVPNAAARSLVSGRSEIVALVVPDITNTFYTRLARGVEDEAQLWDYTLMLGNTDEAIEEERNYLSTLVSHQVLGVILAPAVGAEEHLSLVLDHHIPLVLIDREVPGVKADLVRCDTGEGTRQLVHHLADQGHQTIAFVGGDASLSSLQDRLSGYQQAIKERSRAEYIYLGRYDRQSGEEITERLIVEEALPDAIIAANNKVVEGVLATMRRHGLKVPDDVAVTCIDDIEPAAAIDPFLTVVNQSVYQMGRQAMKLLEKRIGGADDPPEERVLPTELVVRKSSLPRAT